MTTPDQGMPQEAAPSPGSGGGNGIAIAGLVIGIIGLILFWMPFAGLGAAVIALILSIMGMKKAGVLGGAGKGAAVAGIVIAILGILAGGATTACTVACGAAAAQQAAKLESAAKEAGFDSYEAWQNAEPEAAAAAAMGSLGIDLEQMAREMEEAQREAQEDMGVDMDGTGEDEGDEAEAAE